MLGGRRCAPAQAAAICWSVPSLVTNLWQLAIGPNHDAGVAARCAPMLLGDAAPALPARRARLSVVAPAGRASTTALGNARLVVNADRRIVRGPRSAVPARRGMSGCRLVRRQPATGLITAATGVFVTIPAVPRSAGRCGAGEGRRWCRRSRPRQFTVSTLALAALLAATTARCRLSRSPDAIGAGARCRR